MSNSEDNRSRKVVLVQMNHGPRLNCQCYGESETAIAFAAILHSVVVLVLQMPNRD